MSKVCLALFIVLVLVVANSASAASLDMAGYRSALQEALNGLQSGQRSPGDVAATLTSINVVTLPDGSTITPDLSAILDDLQPPIDQANAEAQLSALLGQLDHAEPSGTVDPSTASASLNQVLARSEFQPQSDAQSQTLVGWILHQIGRVLNPITQPIGQGLVRAVRWFASLETLRTLVATGIGIVALSLLGLWAIRGLRRGFAPGIARLPVVAPGERLNAAELQREAEELASSHAYRMAVRAVYLAALLRLDERGVLPFERALTNREVLKNAGKGGSVQLSERLAPLVERFDRHWYGAVVCTEDDYREFSRLAAWAWEAA